MATKQQAVRAATVRGATVEVSGGGRNVSVTVLAPLGMVWLDNDAHVIVEIAEAGRTRTELWDAVLRAVEEGVGECPDTACDTCRPIDPPIEVEMWDSNVKKLCAGQVVHVMRRLEVGDLLRIQPCDLWTRRPIGPPIRLRVTTSMAAGDKNRGWITAKEAA